MRSIVPNLAILAASMTIIATIPSCGASWDYLKEGQRDGYAFMNATVYAMDPDNTVASALVVRGNQIVFVGDEEGAQRHIDENIEVVDAKGKTILPGFIDTHIHPGNTANTLDALSLNPDDSIEKWMDTIQKWAEKYPADPALGGGSFSMKKFGPEGPNKAAIDNVVADRAVFLLADDQINAWVNSKALEVLGIDKNTPDPVPGKHYYERDSAGVPTGWIVGTKAYVPIFRNLKIPPKVDFAAVADDLFPRMSALGITAVFDAGQGDAEATWLQTLIDAEKNGKLPFRYRFAHTIDEAGQIPEAVGTYQKLANDFKSEMVSVSQVKINADGFLEIKTAALLSPYENEQTNNGELRFTTEELQELIMLLDAAGIDTHIHSIGDRSTRVVLDGIEAARNANNSKGKTRHTLAHLQLIADEEVPRFAELDVMAHTTPFWHAPFDYYPDLIGSARLPLLFRFRDLANAGARVTFGSDYPTTGVEEGLEPLFNMQVGHTRILIGFSDDRLGTEADVLTREQMIRGYTIDAAYQLRMEDKIGSLEVGKLADVVVLDEDIFKVDADEIYDIDVRLTMANGKIVHAR